MALGCPSIGGRWAARAPYLRLLFWLKWKLMWRGYSRNMSAAFGVILALLIFLPLAVGVGFGLALGFHALSPTMKPHLARGALLGIYAIWLILPLLGYALNESYDITRLFIFPLSVRQVFTGAILGSLLDFPVLFALPAFAAILFGFGNSLASLLLTLVVIGLFFFHTLSLSQGIMLASSGILRSRRFRDLAMVIVPLLWMGYYVAMQVLPGRAVGVDWASFVQTPTWDYVSYLPPGLAARAISAASAGDPGASLAWIVALALASAATIWLAAAVIQKVYDGETVAFSTRPRPVQTAEPEASARTNAPAGSLDVRRRSPIALPPVIEAVADKELKYLFRDPYFRLTLMNLAYMLIVAVVAFARPSRQPGLEGLGPGAAWGATAMVLLSEMQMVANVFGTEGGAASILFQFPASRRQMLLGKNLVFFTALTVVNLVFMLILSALARVLSMFPALFCWMELALVMLMAIGNMVSVRFPYRIVMKGWRMRQQSSGRSFGYGFLYLGFFLAALGLASPSLAATLVPTFWVSPLWLAVTVPVAAAYSVGLYLLFLRYSATLLSTREVELAETVSRTED